MRVKITVHGVPEWVRDELAARAAAQGRSLQDFLRAELERLAARPSLEMLLQRNRDRQDTLGNS
ncbi:MAG TPA: hypothetical protein VGS57_01195 [Thermoanaerobaculia bacterium]|nr:hypothetical protein [Thermoanaerobaculia bacterium]